MKINTDKDKILIFGGFSHENRGDHAMLAGMIQELKRNNSGTKVVVHSINPEKIRRVISEKVVWSPEIYFLTARALKKFSSLKMLTLKKIRVLIKGLWFILNFLIYKRLNRCFLRNSACIGFFSQLLGTKALVFSGGGYLNSVWALTELYVKAIIIFTAKLADVPIVMSSQSIGPLTGRFDRIIAKLAFNSVKLIGIRDIEKSRNCLQAIGVNKPQIIFTGDDSLLLHSSNESGTREIFFKEKIPADKTLIGVNIRNSANYGNGLFKEIPAEQIAGLLDQIAAHRGRHLVFLPISYNAEDDDRISAEKIQSLMTLKNRTTVVSNYYSPAELKGLISSLHAAIGVSYHFLLFALSSNVPAVSLYFDDYYKFKNSGLFDLYDMSDKCFAMDSPGAVDKIISAFEKMLNERDKVSSRLSDVNGRIKDEANKSHNFLMQFVA
mgnify:CR=1 FL=1